MSQYAAEISDNQRVVRVIEGSAEWAADALGGSWIDCDLCGIDWIIIHGKPTPPITDFDS